MNPLAYSDKNSGFLVKRGGIMEKNWNCKVAAFTGAIPADLVQIGQLAEENRQRDGDHRPIMRFCMHACKYAKTHKKQKINTFTDELSHCNKSLI